MIDAPEKALFGVNVITPPVVIVSVPFATGMVCGVPGVTAVPPILAKVNGSPSISVSLLKGVNTTGVSIGVLTKSATASGLSLIEPIFKVTVAVSVPPAPSKMV